MEELNNTQPVEQQPQQQLPTTVTNDTAPQPAAEPTEQQGMAPSNESNEAQRGKTNWANGRRRIEQRRGMQARIAELEAEIERLHNANDDYSRFRRDSLQDRLGDLHAMEADQEAQAFAERASEWFGDATPQFLEQTSRYAEYVNANEPDLLKYAQRPYGLVLLHEWYKRMDQPATRDQWLAMTPFEKGSVLANFYKQIEAAVAGQRTQPPKSVPVPGSGRQSAAGAPTDDFGIALTEANNRHLRKM
jgi:hypothetical protein